jgi:hypothetical protein
MDRESLAKLAARYTRRAEPVSLTPDELDFEHCNVTRVVPGVPVWAWIRFLGAAELVAGGALPSCLPKPCSVPDRSAAAPRTPTPRSPDAPLRPSR